MKLNELPQLALKAKSFSKRASTSHIAIHCSATEAGKPFKAVDIQGWHLQRGFADIGYHFVVYLDGTVVRGRPLDAVGAHVEGYNATSVGVCYIGGIYGGQAYDTRTDAQKKAMLELLQALKAVYPNAVIQGHKNFPNVAKACPCFDARTEYAKVAGTVGGAK